MASRDSFAPTDAASQHDGAATSCGLGSVECNGRCVYLQTDLHDCGTCGHACEEGMVCSNGKCRLTCAAPQSRCEAAVDAGASDAAVSLDGGDASIESPRPYCADLGADPRNCGQCGHACPHGCSNGQCVYERLVFVTQVQNIAVGGVFGADAICQTRAATAGYEGLFFAWISDGVASPATRFTREGSFVRPDGVLVANDWTDLTDGTLANPISVTEQLGSVEEPYALTAVNADGTAGAPNCGGWGGINGTLWGRVGKVGATDVTWTSDTVTVCGNYVRALYCFQQ